MYQNTGSTNCAFGNNTCQGGTGFENCSFGHQSLFFMTSGSRNCTYGVSSGIRNTSGTYNCAFGWGALYDNTTGSNNVVVGAQELTIATSYTNIIAIGHFSQTYLASSSNSIRIGNNVISSATINVGWTVTSDRRVKENITDNNLGLDFIDKLRPVSYNRKNDEDKKTEYGLIAQEVEETLENIGVSNTNMIIKDREGTYGLRYNDLISILITSVQELKNKCELQQQRIDRQDEIIAKLLEKFN